MIVNGTTLNTLGTGFSALFQRGRAKITPLRQMISTDVPSTTGQNEYGWLSDLPGMREWIGDRVIHQMEANGYIIRNKAWEQTISVKRDDIEDDNVGAYTLRFQLMGEAAGQHPELLAFDALKNGFSQKCYDGQNFFDTDHVVLGEDGKETSVANTDGGDGLPWFLLDDSRSILPIIFQNRRPLSFTAKDKPTDGNVFDRAEYVYGADARYNVGYGFWQTCWGSKQPLNADNYGGARAALSSMTGDYGRPLGISPTLLVVPPKLESAALKIVNNELGANGESNEWKGTAKVVTVPWLA